MTLRTPRRRISPRTKRRYRVIKEFFRKALGSTSQPNIKINSSIAVNVTDLKHKILGIENQLTEVSKHCRDLACLETSFRKETENFGTDAKHNIDSIKEQTVASSEKKSKSSDTKVLYKNNYRRSDESDYATLDFIGINDRKNITPPNNMHHNANVAHTKKKKKVKDRTDVLYNCDTDLRKHKTQSAFDNVASVYSTSSYHSIGPEHSPHIDAGYSKQRRHNTKDVQRREYIEPMEEPRHAKHKEHIRRKCESPPRYPEEKHRSRKAKRGKSRIDQDFITDIIKRQYKPVKLFGRRDSEISQFSAPVCRDQEYSFPENIQEEGEELCSCCFDAHNRSLYTNCVRNYDLSDMRSICDTRLYSSKKNSRIKRHRQYADIYNDAALYDLVPVKEKSSPKSRRKFAEDHMIDYNYYKEVPPSPRTQRPRLNLKAQYYTEYDDYMVQVKPNRRHPKIRPKKQEYIEIMESDITSEIILPKNRREKHKIRKPVKVPSLNPRQQDNCTMSGLPSPTVGNEQNELNNVAFDTTLNKTQDTDISDKTDKALCEIKDILQSFLQEIKKEALSCDNNTEINNKTTQKQSDGIQQNTAMNAGTMLDSAQTSFNNQSIPHCSVPPAFIPPFQNPCCYPILPICPMNPMNCMQNGYMMPSPSFTCHACASNTKETVCCDCSKHKNVSCENGAHTKTIETDEMIKEIYKFVAQSPNSGRKKAREGGQKEVRSPKTKELTSRSVGACSRTSKHDAQVGTPTMKCYSKSCEAIGSRMITDTSYTTTTQSDTVLEKLSLEVTMSDSELSSESTVLEKRKKGKFTKVLQSIGLLKKKKKDIIEETSESESSVEVDVKPKAPFRQEVMNYSMHGQEFFHRPPIPPYTRPEGTYGYGPPPGYDPRTYYPNAMPTSSDPYTHHRVHRETIPEHGPSRYHPDRHPDRHLDRHGYPSAPPYPNYEAHCSHQQPQVPLCLKEIEVKSTGTQSERKMSFFQKLAKKPQTSGTARSDPIKNCSTQTPQTNNNHPTKPEKQGLFTGWKNLQAQAKGDANFNAGKFTYKNPKGRGADTDPMKFSYKTQKQLAAGDVKMRNAVLKKLFYKRNPFSPRNLIVRTILGKDQSSYGEPQMSFRPRMFF